MRTPTKSYCSEEIQSTYYRITWYAQSDVMVLTITSGEGGRSRHCMERSKLNPNSLLATVFSSSGIAGHLENNILIQKLQNRLIFNQLSILMPMQQLYMVFYSPHPKMSLTQKTSHFALTMKRTMLDSKQV